MKNLNNSKASLPTIAYVNGQFVPIADAKVSVLDRGFLFADGCYEVSAVLAGRLVDNPAHMSRLRRSLRELGMPAAVDVDQLPALMQELIDRESLQEGLVYVQVTRGAPEHRDFGFPDPAVVPATVVMFAQAKSLTKNALAESGGKAITIPEIRWARRDIKSIALLPQAMGKQLAVEAGAIEAWMVEDGYITEATAAAVGIITTDNVLITRPITQTILDSVTRRAILKLIESTELTHAERLFTPDDAYEAAEAFVTSATALVTPIVALDDRPIGSGKPGPFTKQLRELYLKVASSPEPNLTDHDFEVNG